MVADLRANDWRRPGCSDACQRVIALVIGERFKSELEIHDRAAHEAWGRLGRHERPLIETGPLVIDRVAMRVWVNAAEISMSHNEWSLLRLLTDRPGETIPYWEILTTIWGTGYAPERACGTASGLMTRSSGELCLLRALANRLRARLGTAGQLIETITAIGLRLRMLPPGTVLPVKGWSARFACCQQCGRTDIRYEARGLCLTCYGEQKRGRHGR